MYMYVSMGGVALLELDNHPDHNKEPDHAPCACPKNQPIDHS